MSSREGSSIRPSRGHPNNRSRGRGPTSRGAPSSSSKSQPSRRHVAIPPAGPRALLESSTSQRWQAPRRSASFQKQYSRFQDTGPATNGDNTFERERLENAAKREARGQGFAAVNGRGHRGIYRGSKQVRFAVQEGQSSSSREHSPPKPVSKSFDGTAMNAPPFGTKTMAPFNPFSGASKPGLANPFDTQGTAKPASTFNPFAPKEQASSFQASNPLERSKSPALPKPPTSIFGAPSRSFAAANPFTTSKPPPFPSQPFASTSSFTPSKPSSSFGTPSQASVFAASSQPGHPFAKSQTQPAANTTQVNGFPVKKQLPSPFTTSTNTTANGIPSWNGSSSSSANKAASSSAAGRMEELLRKEGVVGPAWPETPGDPRQKAAVEAVWQSSKGYRSRVRACLIRGGLLDDPDKPKRLSEAIDFKGTCEDMCPDFEKLTRINEHDVPGPEKELAPDGKSLWPSPRKMIKALARSAAGQEAPLPMDVRSPAALKMTVDYLIHEVLGKEGELAPLHGFLWDRTRAVRRDFVFQSSMNATELADQINCLERISRFHVVSLHQMSRQDVVAESFVEQQELEQLGKALLSLVHTYDDCKAKGIKCENESEFRAYYVLFNGKNPGILETVQDWGWKFWGESDEVKTAVSLVEALQNITNLQGPLKPYASTDIAQNAYSRFFSIVEDRQVSYTMACFAEIHFNAVRRSALKTILASYRKQRDQSKDWTLEKLNTYLKFDDENEIIDFGEAHGLRFEENEGEEYLVLDSDNQMEDPFPPLKQRHSYSLVERKRGKYSLPDVIDTTVYDEMEGRDSVEVQQWGVADTPKDDIAEEESLFIPEDEAPWTTHVKAQNSEQGSNSRPFGFSPSSNIQSQPNQVSETKPEGRSLFERIEKPKQFGSDFFQSAAPLQDPQKPEGKQPQSMFSKPSMTDMSSVFAPKATDPTQNDKPSMVFGSFQPQPPVKASPVPPNLASSDSHTTSGDLRPQFPTSLGGFQVTKPTTPAFPGASLASLPQDSHPTSNPASSTQTQQQVSRPATNSALSQSPSFSAAPQTNDTSAFQTSSFNIAATKPQALGDASQGLAQSDPIHASTVHPPIPSKPVEPPVDPRVVLDHVADWLVNGKQGIMEHFAEITLETLLRDVALGFVEEERLRVAAEESREIRHRYLSNKYFKRWRIAAHRLWLRRQGREARKARQEMAESFRTSKAARSDNLVGDFKASVRTSRQSSPDDQTDVLEMLKDIYKPSLNGKEIARVEPKASPKERQKHPRARSSQTPESRTQRQTRPSSKQRKTPESERSSRGDSEDPIRRSLLSDSTYLAGGSRIHLLKDYSVQDENRRQPNGVQTDYFRLKARGISTLPNGNSLPRSVGKDVLHRKRTFDGVGKTPLTPKTSKVTNSAKSAPSKSMRRLESSQARNAKETDMEDLKARAKALIAEEQKTRHKRTLDNDDEVLFARAKRVREKMDEGARWFKEEVERASQSRSVS